MKSKTLQVRLTPDEKNQMEDIAKAEKLSISAFLYKYVQKVIKQSAKTDDWLQD